jgi:Flp pilus assembly protein TadG
MARWRGAGQGAVSRLRSGQDGAAIVEFLGLAVLLMVPLVYVLLTVFEVQRAAYAVSSASREAGRVFVGAESAAQGELRAGSAAQIVLRDSGLELAPGALTLSCSADPCLTPGATVTVRLDHDVRLPLAPPFVADLAPASVPVTGTNVAVVDRFRPERP